MYDDIVVTQAVSPQDLGEISSHSKHLLNAYNMTGIVPEQAEWLHMEKECSREWQAVSVCYSDRNQGKILNTENSSCE